MRILNVRFKNLNSLVGEWEINFTHPSYVADGLFAITGPTGAGKTTILDAICLALYGKTPRLEMGGKNGNEIMSRHKGECFAEVTFATQNGRYRCFWGQHRSRKKGDGELQIPRYELIDDQSQAILSHSISASKKEIEAVTGMSFEQFTRSMMLAQGEFAAFLRAKPDERAPILEQITGTDLYSKISMAVHERRKIEEEKKNILSLQLKGLQPLSWEDEQQWQGTLQQKKEQDFLLTHKIEQVKHAIVWLDGMTQLENELQGLQEQKQRLRMRQESFQPEKEKLSQAKKALELEREYGEMVALRRQLAIGQDDLLLRQQAIPQKEVDQQGAKERLQATQQAWEQKKIEHQQLLVTIGKVRILDAQINDKAMQVKTVADECGSKKQNCQAMQAKYYQTQVQLNDQNDQWQKVQNYLQQQSQDEGLVEHLARLGQRLQEWQQQDRRLQQQVVYCQQVAQQIKQYDRQWQEQKAACEKQKQNVMLGQNNWQQRQNSLSQLLAGKEVGEWRLILAQKQARKQGLEKIAHLLQSGLALQRQMAAGQGQQQQWMMQRQSLSEQIVIQSQRQSDGEKEEECLARELALLQKMANLFHYRQHLKEGEACPLCGATEHPLAVAEIPSPNETEQKLRHLRSELKQVRNTIARLQVEEGKKGTEIDHLLLRQSERMQQMEQEKGQLAELMAALNIDGDEGWDGPGMVAQWLVSLDGELNDLLALVQQVEETEKNCHHLTQSLAKLREEVALLALAQQQGEHQYKSAVQEGERAASERENLLQQWQTMQQEMMGELVPYGIVQLTVPFIEPILQELTKRRDVWRSQQQQKVSLVNTMAMLDNTLLHYREQLVLLEADFTTKTQILAVQMDELQAMKKERQHIFADLNPDHEEKQWQVRLSALEKQKEMAQKNLLAIEQDWEKLKNYIREMENKLLADRQALQGAEQSFVGLLMQQGFSDEKQFIAARLSEEQRQGLEVQEQALVKEQNEWAAKWQDGRQKLATQQALHLTEQSRPQLAEEYQSVVDEQREIQQAIGAIGQKLQENALLRHRQQEHIQVLELQTVECQRWNRLHELIGSVDGKKYRNFAQGMTFDLMIGHANRQLQKMSDRYLLIRDESSPLELNVVDHYQAGVKRSTKNLSGGESFIVSLALALGLSHMSSMNVRVDSLFLDEGFGTLDEEALDTALETLAGLQQDGKLIGIISHVPAIKERISNQIQVVPHSGGRSTLHGPGCRVV